MAEVDPKQRAKAALVAGVGYDLFEAATAATAAQGRFPRAPAEDLAWWRDGRVGMFVHWNFSSVKPCMISWAMNFGGVMPDDYYALARRFNPTRFDARAWAGLIKDSGFANLLLVVKHHDGFAMWDTRHSDWKITNTPYGRDVWRELTVACRQAGLPLGAYYSPADWRHPAARAADWPSYSRFMQGQWLELFRDYGPLATFECDYWQNFSAAGDWAGFYRELRRLQPHALFSRNTAWCEGDFEVHEWGVGSLRRSAAPPGPPTNAWSRMDDTAPWQTLMSVDGRGWWSYNPDPCCSFEKMMAWVISAAANDGNILINFTPGPTGEFPPDQLALMTRFGQFMRARGESIRGTRGGPYRPVYAFGGLAPDHPDAAPVLLKSYHGKAYHIPKVASTSKGNRVYLHVLGDVPGARLRLPTPGLRLCRAAVLSRPGVLVPFEQEEQHVLLLLPPRGGETDMVLALEFDRSVMELEPMDLAPVSG